MPNTQILIQNLIADGQLDQALGLAKKAALASHPELDTTVTLLQAEFEHLQRALYNGLIDFKEESSSRQNINLRLLNLVNGLDGQIPQTGAATSTPKEVLLFLGANPFKSLPLELEREVEEVSRGLEQFGKRQAFDFRAKIHVTPTDLQRMLLEADLAPRFVHFAGNAVVNHPHFGTGVIFEDEKGDPRVVHGDVLAKIFKQFPSVECVFLNTCDSGPSALAIGQQVRYAIGMNAMVYDESAIIFAVAFYEAIASGNEVPFAFEFARTRLEMEAYPEQARIPVLIEQGVCAEPVYQDGAGHLTDMREARVVR